LISIILPAYNEAERLSKSVEEVIKVASSFTQKYEIIIAEDGSTDGTDLIASKLAKENKRIIHLHSNKRLGRGKSIENSLKMTKGTIVAYIDVDLEAKPEFLKNLIDAIIKEGYDISIGSRFIKGSIVKRSFLRTLLSRIYNFLVKMILKSKIKDHQCGLKAFKKDVLLKITKKFVLSKHWFWDTEVLIFSQLMGYKIKEVPIIWIEENKKTKVKVLKDSVDMFLDIFRLWKRLKFLGFI